VKFEVQHPKWKLKICHSLKVVRHLEVVCLILITSESPAPGVKTEQLLEMMSPASLSKCLTVLETLQVFYTKVWSSGDSVKFEVQHPKWKLKGSEGNLSNCLWVSLKAPDSPEQSFFGTQRKTVTLYVKSKISLENIFCFSVLFSLSFFFYSILMWSFFRVYISKPVFWVIQ